MTPLDTVSWYGMGGYNMRYPIKYTTPFRPIFELKKVLDLIVRYILYIS